MDGADPEQGLILSLFAPHALDFVQLFMGDDPINVKVEAARRQSGWLGEDKAMILPGYPRQRMESIPISYSQSFVFDQKTEFERALVRIEDGEFLWVDGDCVKQPETGEAQTTHRMGGRDLFSYFQIQLAERLRAVWGPENRAFASMRAAV